jgi:hypothetical protein
MRMETSHNGEVRVLHFLTNIMETARSAGHVKRMGHKVEVHTKFWQRT